MPVFGPETLDDEQVASIVRYVEYLRTPTTAAGTRSATSGRCPRASSPGSSASAPCCAVAYWIGTPADRRWPARERRAIGRARLRSSSARSRALGPRPSVYIAGRPAPARGRAARREPRRHRRGPDPVGQAPAAGRATSSSAREALGSRRRGAVPRSRPASSAGELGARTAAASARGCCWRAVGALGLAAAVPHPLARAQPRAHAQTHGVAPAEAARTREDGSLVRVDDLEVGGVVTVFPEGHADAADRQTLVDPGRPDQLRPRPGREDWSPRGHTSPTSKICTHVGCPVGLYRQTTHALLCPCHQSTFDVLDGARPIFGPATRSLPQLPLEVDDEGCSSPTRDFTEPGRARLLEPDRTEAAGRRRSPAVDRRPPRRVARSPAPRSTRSSPTTGRS